MKGFRNSVMIVFRKRYSRNFARFSVLLATALACVCPASAQTQRKPYEPLPVTYDRSAETDASLRALIEILRAAVAEQKLFVIDAALAPSVMTYECNADPVKPCPAPAPEPIAQVAALGPARSAALSKPGKSAAPKTAKPDARLAALAKLPPAQRLRIGLCCRDVPVQHITKAMREDAVLGAIGAALEEETLGAHPDLPGAVCAPAWPVFDRARAAQIAVSADIDNANLRVSTAELALREKPAKDAGAAATITAGQVVAFVTDAAEALPDGWSSVALPQGGLGYTNQGGMADLTPAGVCFSKDDSGVWKISAVVQRHS
jgi:hypothetical protein